MKKLIAIILSLTYLNLNAQEFAEVPYKLDLPQGWFQERINFPINFAPELPYKGGEDIRFAPGWGKAGSENYWSYAFLWYLDGEVKIDTASLNKDMKIYYNGLVAAGGKKLSPEKIIPVETSFKETKIEKGDASTALSTGSKTFLGTIRMTDYMSGDPLSLKCKVHVRICENKTCVFFELSPQAFNHKVWKDLHKLWTDFKCKK